MSDLLGASRTDRIPTLELVGTPVVATLVAGGAGLAVAKSLENFSPDSSSANVQLGGLMLTATGETPVASATQVGVPNQPAPHLAGERADANDFGFAVVPMVIVAIATGIRAIRQHRRQSSSDFAAVQSRAAVTA